MANTPNIDLVKPAGTDHALVSVLNANSDKIDTFAGTTNAAIANLGYDIGSKTVSGFQSDIETKLGALDNGKSFSFKVDLSDSVSPISSGTHTGIATRSVSGRYNVLLQRSGSTTCTTYAGSLTSNGWAWQELALKSDIATVSSSSTVAAGSSENVSYPTGFTRDTCVVIAVYYTTSSTRQFQNVAASLGSSNISLINNDSTARSITCVLQKI